MTSNVIARSIGSNVKAEIARHRTTQAQIARVIGKTPMAVTRRVSGEIPFSAVELSAIADHLGVPVERFYETQVKTQPALAGAGEAS